MGKARFCYRTISIEYSPYLIISSAICIYSRRRERLLCRLHVIAQVLSIFHQHLISCRFPLAHLAVLISKPGKSSAWNAQYSRLPNRKSHSWNLEYRYGVGAVANGLIYVGKSIPDSAANQIFPELVHFIGSTVRQSPHTLTNALGAAWRPAIGPLIVSLYLRRKGAPCRSFPAVSPRGVNIRAGLDPNRYQSPMRTLWWHDNAFRQYLSTPDFGR